MNIHISLTARDIREDELRGRIAVVIDVLRATSVMITAISNGARWVRAVASVEEALALQSGEVLLGGERHALRIEGFDLTNSPLEYTTEKVAGKGIVLSTTNGTLALSKCGLAEEVLVGAFLNQNALTDYLAARNLPVELICAGTNGEFSLDDFLCAGLICSTLRSAGPAESGDLGRLAIQTWEAAKADIHTALSSATHYNVLRNKGFLADLDYCLTRDSHPVIVRKNRESGAFETI